MQVAANTLAPYAAAAIGRNFGHGENKNETAQVLGHFLLGAALAYVNGADPLSGGSAAIASEKAAEYLAAQYNDGVSYNNEAGEFEPNRLPENVKQEIRAITGAIGALVGGVSGSAHHGNGNAVDVLTNAQVGGVVGQNAVENNIVESLWDAVNVSLGVVSFQDNFRNGNYGSATVDAIGLLYDIPATVVPLLPAGASTGIKVYRAGNSVRASATIARGTTKINNAANIATRNTLNTAKNSASIGSKGAANRLSGAASSYFGGTNKATGIQLATAGVLYSTSYSYLNTISSNQGQGSHEGGQKQNRPEKATATQPQQVVAAAGAPIPPDPDDHNNGNNRSRREKANDHSKRADNVTSNNVNKGNSSNGISEKSYSPDLDFLESKVIRNGKIHMDGRQLRQTINSMGYNKDSLLRAREIIQRSIQSMKAERIRFGGRLDAGHQQRIKIEQDILDIINRRMEGL